MESSLISVLLMQESVFSLIFVAAFLVFAVFVTLITKHKPKYKRRK